MEEPDVTTADVDYDFFDEKVWPVMANRAKCFENLKVLYNTGVLETGGQGG